MQLVPNDFVSMEITFDDDVERAFLLGAFSTTVYDFEIMGEGILQVDVPLGDVSNFYNFVDETFKCFRHLV